MKICGHCRQELKIEEFYKDKNSKDGFRSWCKKCRKKEEKKNYIKNKTIIRAYQKKWKRQHKEERSKQWKKYYIINSEKEKKRLMNYKTSTKGLDARSNKMYGVSVSDMLGWQNHKCAICQKSELENSRKLHIDHDHKIGQIRMLLCHGCNTASGIADNVELLLAKVEYIKAYLI